MKTFFKHEDEQPTRIEAAITRTRERARQQRDVYAMVDARDGHHCRACGVRTEAGISGRLRKGDHHHIVFRSAGGGTTTSNVVLLCAVCHNDIHRHRLRIEGNADEALTFWRTDADGVEYVERRELSVRMVEKD